MFEAGYIQIELCILHLFPIYFYDLIEFFIGVLYNFAMQLELIQLFVVKLLCVYI